MDKVRITEGEMFKLMDDMSIALYRLVAECCTNTLSENRLYIVSRILDGYGCFDKERQNRLWENSFKTPVPLAKLVPGLVALYPTVYDFNLHVHKAKADVTVIDIRYYSKYNLDTEHFERVKDKKAMVHSKVYFPSWVHETNDKFDVNWEHKGE